MCEDKQLQLPSPALTAWAWSPTETDSPVCCTVPHKHVSVFQILTASSQDSRTQALQDLEVVDMYMYMNLCL